MTPYLLNLENKLSYTLNNTFKSQSGTKSYVTTRRLLDLTEIEKAEEEFMRHDNIIGCDLEEVLQRRGKYSYIGI